MEQTYWAGNEREGRVYFLQSKGFAAQESPEGLRERSRCQTSKGHRENAYKSDNYTVVPNLLHGFSDRSLVQPATI
jgi:hypothetical protein